MADRSRRAPGSVEATPLRVAVRADDPALEARIAALLNDVADVSVGDDARADVLVIAMTPARALDALRGAAKTILLVDRVDAGWTLEAVRAGARAVLPLEMEAMTLAHALRAVAAGLVVLHPEPLRDEERRTARAFLPENGSLAAPIEPLTERELQVLHLLAEGLSNKAIARRLAISDHTVKFHLAAIFSKLDAKSRAEALAQAIRFGLVHL
jgi:DNA-binding NarL/FixJ family response regulator